MRQIQIYELSTEDYRALKREPFTIVLPNGIEITLQVEGRRSKRSDDTTGNITRSGASICKICGKSYKGLQGINVHMFRKHPDKQTKKLLKQKPFKCKICGVGSVSQKGLDSHMFRKHKGK